MKADNKSRIIMKRDIDANIISSEKLMNSSDMAKLGCSNCEGCSDCCRDRASAITLDAWDIMLLKNGLNYSFEGLINSGLISLAAIDGIILPTLSVRNDTEECIFLDQEGRCSIHSFRPGICRMFPLARLWHEDGSFSYFMQPGECSHSNGVKIKISKWLGYDNIREYESSVRIWHDALRELRCRMAAVSSHEELITLQRSFLETWFVQDAPFS